MNARLKLSYLKCCVARKATRMTSPKLLYTQRTFFSFIPPINECSGVAAASADKLIFRSDNQTNKITITNKKIIHILCDRKILLLFNRQFISKPVKMAVWGRGQMHKETLLTLPYQQKTDDNRTCHDI